MSASDVVMATAAAEMATASSVLPEYDSNTADTVMPPLAMFYDCEVLWEHRRALGKGSFANVWALQRVLLRRRLRHDGDTPIDSTTPAAVARRGLSERINAAAKAIKEASVEAGVSTVVVPKIRLDISANAPMKMMAHEISSEAAEQLATTIQQPRWVVKRLHDEYDDENTAENSLVQELAILLVIRRASGGGGHQHLIGLHGMGIANGHFNEYAGDDDATRDPSLQPMAWVLQQQKIPPSFLILDRLQATLDDWIDTWRERHRWGFWEGLVGAVGTSFGGGGNSGGGTTTLSIVQQQWQEGLVIVAALSDALAFLHARNIIYRDMKPDNVGMDDYGVVKLFDFGLAKCLPLDDSREQLESTYHLTGQTGTLRYMAPEVARNETYGYGVDVYSLGVILHQVMSLEEPFGEMEEENEGNEEFPELFRQQVVNGGLRPVVPPEWPVSVQELLGQMWNDRPEVRPSAHQVGETLFPVFDAAEHLLRANVVVVGSVMTKLSGSSMWSSFGRWRNGGGGGGGEDGVVYENEGV